MIALYRQGSIQNVSGMESMPVEYNQRWSKNRKGGSGGNIGRTGPYYLCLEHGAEPQNEISSNLAISLSESVGEARQSGRKPKNPR